MSAAQLEFHRLAVVEARAAHRWYRQRSLDAAQRFIAELDRIVELIQNSPDAFPIYLHGTRVKALKRFPYFVVYLHVPPTVHIAAVAHGRRRPGYWRRRIGVI